MWPFILIVKEPPTLGIQNNIIYCMCYLGCSACPGPEACVDDDWVQLLVRRVVVLEEDGTSLFFAVQIGLLAGNDQEDVDEQDEEDHHAWDQVVNEAAQDKKDKSTNKSPQTDIQMQWAS